MENGFEGANKTESGLVYVVHNDWIQNPKAKEGCKTYKIGKTKHSVSKRYSQMDGKMPTSSYDLVGLTMPSEFICDFAYEFNSEQYHDVEKGLQSVLDLSRVGGEWFDLNEKALEGIKWVCEKCGGKLITTKVQREVEKEVEESVARTRHEYTEEECAEDWKKEENRPLREIAEYLKDLISKSGAIDDLDVRYEKRIVFKKQDKNNTYFNFMNRGGVSLLLIYVNEDKLPRLTEFLENERYPFELEGDKGVRILIKDKAFVEQHQDMFIEVARFVKELKARA